MPSFTDNNRKRMHDLLNGWRSSAWIGRDAAAADQLREVQEDVIITSPKVYESGIITSLDLRLVDLYGDCASDHDDATPTPAAPELSG